MKRIMILSGAGLSKESGIDTFRDNDGLWENHDVMEVCSREGWIKNRKLVQSFYDQRRVELKDKKPNKAHHFLADLEKKARVIHLTQNVDNLMDKAGSKCLIHLHGTLTDLRCELCTESFPIGYTAQDEATHCPHCGNKRVRHNVVMFGESAPNYTHINQATKQSSILIVIGTSGTVIDITKIAKEFEESILIDPNRTKTKSTDNKHEYIDEYFKYFIQKNATDSLEELDTILNKLM